MLEIDHVNGDGKEHRRRTKGARRYFLEILDSLDSYQLLCANCHRIKDYARIRGGGRQQRMV